MLLVRNIFLGFLIHCALEARGVDVTSCSIDEKVRAIESGELRRVLKDVLTNMQQLQDSAGYGGFNCAMDIITVTFESVWPKWPKWRSPSKKGQSRKSQEGFKPTSPKEQFEDGIVAPARVLYIAQQFKIVEYKHGGTSRLHSASQKIPSSYITLYALMKRCTNDTYKEHLDDRSRQLGLHMRKEALRIYRVADDASEADIDEAYSKMALSCAVKRQIANAFHHLFKTLIERATENELVQVLQDLELLSLWKYTEEDIEVINAIRKFDGVVKFPVTALHFNQNVTIPGGLLTEHVDGNLPYVNLSSCPKIRTALVF